MSDFEAATKAVAGSTYTIEGCPNHDFPVSYISSVGCAMCHISKLEAEKTALQEQVNVDGVYIGSKIKLAMLRISELDEVDSMGERTISVNYDGLYNIIKSVFLPEGK